MVHYREKASSPKGGSMRLQKLGGHPHKIEVKFLSQKPHRAPPRLRPPPTHGGRNAYHVRTKPHFRTGSSPLRSLHEIPKTFHSFRRGKRLRWPTPCSRTHACTNTTTTIATTTITTIVVEVVLRTLHNPCAEASVR